MKYIKKTLDFNTPTLQKIKVNTNTDYMVEFDVTKNGEHIVPSSTNLFVYDTKGDDNWNYQTNITKEHYFADEWKNETSEFYTGWIKIGFISAGSPNHGIHINNRFLNQNSWKFSYDDGTTWKTLNDEPTVKFKIQSADTDDFAEIKNDGKVYDKDDKLIQGNYILRWLAPSSVIAREDVYMWVENVAPETTLKVTFGADYELSTVIPVELFRDKYVASLKSSHEPNDRDLLVDYISPDKVFDIVGKALVTMMARLMLNVYIKNAGRVTFDMIKDPLKVTLINNRTGEPLNINVNMKGAVGRTDSGAMGAWISQTALNIYPDGLYPVEVPYIEVGVNAAEDLSFSITISNVSGVQHGDTFTGIYKIADGVKNTWKCAINEEIGDGDVGNATAEKTANFRFITADGDEVSYDMVIK